VPVPNFTGLFGIRDGDLIPFINFGGHRKGYPEERGDSCEKPDLLTPNIRPGSESVKGFCRGFWFFSLGAGNGFSDYVFSCLVVLLDPVVDQLDPCPCIKKVSRHGP